MEKTAAYINPPDRKEPIKVTDGKISTFEADYVGELGLIGRAPTMYTFQKNCATNEFNHFMTKAMTRIRWTSH